MLPAMLWNVTQDHSNNNNRAFYYTMSVHENMTYKNIHQTRHTKRMILSGNQIFNKNVRTIYLEKLLKLSKLNVTQLHSKQL